MKIKNLMRPAIAVVAILAVGAAAAVAGTNFAQPAASGQTTTVELPVLQPVGYGDHAPDLDSDGDPDTGEVSPIQGTRTVPVGADGLPDAGRDFTDAIDTIMESESPDASGFVFDIVDGEGDGDPCAPEGEAEVEGCPDGIRGAVFAVVAPDELWARGSTPHAPSESLPNYAVQCEPVDHPDSPLPFGFVSNAPGTVSMRYWPSGNEAAAVTVEATTPAAATEAWETGLADSDAFEGDWTNVNTCLVLNGLEKYERYIYQYTFTDILDRVFTNDQGYNLSFGLPEDRTVPPTLIEQVGRNAVMLSAPHTERVGVRFNVQVVDEGETADCTLRGDHLPLVSDDGAIKTTVDVSPEFLAENGYLPRYTQRTSTAVYVPEGSTIVACVAEVDHDRPGWEWLEAQRHTWRILQTPDAPRPLVAVDSVTLFGDVDADSVSVSVAWPNNKGACGLWSGPDEDGQVVDSGEFDSPCGDHEHAITQDDAIVHVRVRHDDEYVHSSFVLPLSSLACLDGCEPPSAWYSVPLSIDGAPLEMCGSGMRAPCDPVEAVGAVGTASIRVDWVDGSSNGLTEWQVSDESRAEVEHELDPLPQMEWLVTPTATMNESTRSATISFPLTVDRPVDYSVTAVTESGCERPSARLTQTGRVTEFAGAGINLLGACLGMIYKVAVTLVDDEGTTSVFGFVPGATQAFPDSQVRTPDIPTGLYLWYHVGLEENVAQLKIVQLRVSVDGQEIDPLLPERNCAYGHSFGHRAGGPLLPRAGISEESRVEITLQLAPAYGSTEGMTAYCDAGWDEAPEYTVSAVVSPDDLFGPLVITLPEEAPYSGTFTLGRIPVE